MKKKLIIIFFIFVFIFSIKMIKSEFVSQDDSKFYNKPRQSESKHPAKDVNDDGYKQIKSRWPYRTVLTNGVEVTFSANKNCKVLSKDDYIKFWE